MPLSMMTGQIECGLSTMDRLGKFMNAEEEAASSFQELTRRSILSVQRRLHSSTTT